MLAAYGAAVLVAAGSGLASRRWFVAGRIFAAGAALYVVALLMSPEAQNASLMALGLPLVVAGFGVLPFSRGELLRPRLRTLGLLTGAASIHLGFAPLSWMGRPGAAFAIGIAGCVWLLFLELTDGEPAGRLVDGLGDLEEGPAQWMDGAIIPGLFLCGLALAFGTDAAVPFGIAAAVLLASTSRRSGTLRDALALSTWGAASLASWLSTRAGPAACIASVAWTSISLLWVGVLWLPSATWTWTSRVSLALTSLWTLALLAARPRYLAFPFTTAESGAALAVGLAWAAALLAARKQTGAGGAGAARIGLGAFVFLWGHLELAESFSPTAGSLLLMGYYAVGSVAFVGWGRAQHSATLRRVGLGLGLIAALLAVRGAWDLPGAGTRIAAYLLVSGFLLGIAWWYRQPDDAAGVDSPNAA
jgi:hypothetical protein